ncbi:MAG: 3-deoxy-manno-octulosonate cytidylyltransferase [Gemmatimonadota bacterium]|jgi:3-deoxy-manno-octulosonate cytidylyltransferase (CMP-KDO synthetase)|nr:3-deoxy-manno-octulosonate cytidylyltransferase [Gemmatimonadota bacterium]MDP6802283.1 3-deoxy-manno-octulosonate cytidylyltransferase [Gemmatimonadota bacterium]MDP7031983.1 3-deoxy-manno-octulosonate cytidylyltransferase [Gemmatimonadota bacterium]
MKIVAVIPARMGSVRFPGKPLAPILGQPLLAWVVAVAKACRSVDRVIVATDTPEIAVAAEKAGAEGRMTSPEHRTGTDRVAEAVRDTEADIVLNVQGDEPTLLSTDLDALLAVFSDSTVDMATLVVRGADAARRSDPDSVKVVTDDDGNALYFSRAPVPYCAPVACGDADGRRGADAATLLHVGVYAFRRAALERFVSAERTGLEELEDLEQLRALRMGWKIRVVEVEKEPLGVDRPEDIPAVESWLKARGQGVGR